MQFEIPFLHAGLAVIVLCVVEDLKHKGKLFRHLGLKNFLYFSAICFFFFW